MLPLADHHQCCKHIIDNWNKDSHDVQLKRLFWKIARSYTKWEYVANLEALRRYNPNSFTPLRALRVITCSNCKNEGHNKQRCTNQAVPNEPKRARGRPRMNKVSVFISSTKTTIVGQILTLFYTWWDNTFSRSRITRAVTRISSRRTRVFSRSCLRTE